MLIEYGLFVAWLRRRTPRLRVAVQIGLLICVLVPLLQFLVTTQRERISAVCAALVKAVEAGDVAAIDSQVSDRFAAEDFDKESFMAFVRSGLERNEVEDATMRIESIEIDGNKATVVLMASCTVNSDFYQGPLPSKWRVIFMLEDGEWRMIDVTPVSTPSFPIDRLSDLRV